MSKRLYSSRLTKMQHFCLWQDQQKWDNTYLETTYKLEGSNIANYCFQDK